MSTSTKPITRTGSSTTAYAQIESRLRGKIRRGEWPAGTMLPSRRDLAREYGVSPLTIDRAVTCLIADGLLRADDRRGTFVTRTESAADTSEEEQEITRSGSGRFVRPAVTSQTIGIVASLYLQHNDHLELNNFWVRLLLQSLEHAFSEEGWTTHFFNRAQAPGQPSVPLRDAIATVMADGVDAVTVIALGIDPKEVDDSLSVLDGQNIPVVCVTSSEISRPVPHLFYDNRSAGYQAAEHLLRRGCREILYIAPFTASWVRERCEGIQAVVEHMRLPGDTVCVFPRRSGPWVQEEDPELLGYQAAHSAFEEGLVHGGIVCANDGVAFGFLRAASERGLTAGADFALVSFDDHPDARVVGLTTMRPPMEMMGKEGARLLSRALHGERTDLQVRLRSHLIPRKSTRVPTAGARTIGEGETS